MPNQLKEAIEVEEGSGKFWAPYAGNGVLVVTFETTSGTLAIYNEPLLKQLIDDAERDSTYTAEDVSKMTAALKVHPKPSPQN